MGHILIIDDSPTIRMLLCRILETDGYKVVHSSDGDEALQEVFRSVPKLVIVDVNMPKMNGTEFIHRLRNHQAYRQIPILVISAENSQRHMNEAKAAGATAWLMKPTRPRQLLGLIRELLARD